jgi:hypothetical protein
MRGHSPETLNGMILRIVHECAGFLDEPFNSGLEENWVHIFNHGIADQVVHPNLVIFLGLICVV